jgi:hypothetical protein
MWPIKVDFRQNLLMSLCSIFTPQVARMIPPRPVTADDLERDRVLEQRIALFKWIEPEHLDIPDGHGREGFLMFAQQGSSHMSVL